MHQSSFVKMKIFAEEVLERHGSSPITVCDVGSLDVNGTYRSLFNRPSVTYVGLDLSAGPGVDVVLEDHYKWPQLADASVDVVISGQAFEHIEYPWLTMLEISRVLKSGGRACIIAPAAGPEHRYPVDCWRIYPDGMRALARYAGLEVVYAGTEWNPHAYTDGSEQWKDTVLVASKGNLPCIVTKS